MEYRSINEKRRAIKPNMLIVGIDIAKRSHCARARFPDRTFSPPFFFANNIHGIKRFLVQAGRWRAQAGLDDMIIGMEPTGHYYKPLARWLKNLGCRVVLVSPRDVKREKTRFNNNPTKGDAKDAILIADLVAEGGYCAARLATGQLAVLQRLVGHRRQLMKDQSVTLNRLQADLDERFPEFATVFPDFQSLTVRSLLAHYPSPASLVKSTPAAVLLRLKRDGVYTIDRERLKTLLTKAGETIGSEEGFSAETEIVIQDKLKALELIKAQLASVDAKIERLALTFEETEYMTSLDGIGLLSAGVILAETGGLSNYRAGDAAVKMAGLDLCECSTGETRGQRHISHYGRRLLRSILYFDAIVQARQGMPLHGLYMRLLAKGKSKIEALVAVAAEILRILYALVRDKRYYTPEPPKKQLVPAI